MTEKAFEQAYLAKTEKTRVARLKWFQDARFGMFIHWGLYSQKGRNEWVMNLERIPVKEYEPLAETWHPKKGFAKAWAKLAKQAGMKYMVMTTKHHEGFLLWDSKMSDYNAAKHGPGRDLVEEYVEAVRSEGLKLGFYYSLMDWHHPDGHLCAKDEGARKRFTEYTEGCVHELVTKYGKLDILWYDVSWPLTSPQAWNSFRINDMVRKIQPHIIINDRSQIPEDFGTPEEHITAAAGDRAWEACMTFNGSWGFQKTPPEDWHSSRKVIDMLRTCTAGAGNLLLNIGPHPDGTIPDEAIDRLGKVGQWTKRYGDVMYGKVDRVASITSAMGNWTRKGNRYYYWCSRWPGKELAIGALTGELASARLYPEGAPLTFTQSGDRLVISGLPETCPDKINEVAVIEMTFRTPPRQFFSCGCQMPDVMPADLAGKWVSAPVTTWKVSKLQKKPAGGVAKAACVGLKKAAGWTAVKSGDGFVNIHERVGERDGLVYFANRFAVAKGGDWNLLVGHDGGCRVFVDGRAVLCEPKTTNPCIPGRSSAGVSLGKGTHEIVIALDTAEGKGWGIFLHFELAPSSRKGAKAYFPQVM